ncbi:MAG: DUF1573 domain-containing protein [Bacteroidaceae bacterium]|nr:DUF1573 domain-containing protein [Bacteroidaceae bacterium]MBR6894017.1 DUF1573 domain-containing protein [Bacteroidaceae bacterium]
MKGVKVIMMVLACVFAMSATAKKYPVIKFEKTTIDFGTFSQDNPVQTCVFKFKNVGKAKLAITYVHTSCGCTVADYPKDFISPGGSGEIKVTYDGTGKLPGKLKKTIQVFYNGKPNSEDLVRIYVTGDMTAVSSKDLSEAKK